MTRGIKIFALGLAAATALVSTASAGGFGRGTADTDILYEPGNFTMRAGALYVAPQRGYDTINGAAATDGDYTNSYVVPSTAMKLNFTDTFRCSGAYTEVYGASTNYGEQAQTASRLIIPGIGPTSNSTESVRLSVDELSATCAIGFDVGPGRAWVIGGGFLEAFDYTEVTDFGTLSFNGGYQPGYRIGVAYEVPEIALRGQLLYRSGVDHTPNGTYVGLVPSPTGGLILPPSLYGTKGVGETPQSVEAKFQTGVAAGTLVFASVKWTDWSVIDTLDYTIADVVPSQNEYYWKDGWTVSAGVGRQFTDNIAGQVSLTWDQGVSTGYDILTDTWTVASGVQITGDHGALQIGGAVSYLTAGSQEAGKADFNATADGDFAYAVGASFKLNF